MGILNKAVVCVADHAAAMRQGLPSQGNRAAVEDEGDPRMTQPFCPGRGRVWEAAGRAGPRYGNLNGVVSSLYQRLNLVKFFLGELGVAFHV